MKGNVLKILLTQSQEGNRSYIIVKSKNKGADQLRGNAQLIGTFVFAAPLSFIALAVSRLQPILYDLFPFYHEKDKLEF